MPRPRATAARYVALSAALAVLAGLLAPLAASGPQQGDCEPAPLAPGRATAEPPTDDQIRQAAAPGKGNVAQVPTAPFPPATTGPPRATPNDPPPPCVAVRVRVPAEAAPGQELKYQIVAENVSRADAHHVTVRVPAPLNAKYVRATPTPAETGATILWKLGTLEGGAKKEIELIALPTGDGEVSCCARVQYEHGQCVKTKLARPGVQLEKTGPVEAAKYDPLKFKIEVSNTGRATAKNVVVEETLPAGLDYSNSTPSTNGENPLTWKLGDLEPGKTRVIECEAIPSGTGTLATKAVVTADGGVKREATHTVRIGEPALSVLMTGPKHRYAGRPATYRLTVRNTGTLAAKHVELSDELPVEIEYLKSATGKLDRDHVKWKLGTLAAGASKTVEVTVKATKAGTFKNVATATADRGLREQAVAHTRFDLLGGLALEADKAEDPLVVGQTTAWTFRVLNRGATTHTDVTVVLRVPEGLQAAEVRGARVEAAGIVLPTLASLAPGKEQAVVVRLTAQKAGDHVVGVDAGSKELGPAGVKVEETLRVGEATTSRRPGRTEPVRSSFGP